MNGDDILLDTNAFIYFFEGRPAVAERILLAETVYYSVISEIELLSAAHLTDDERATIRAFLARCQRVDLTPDIVERAIGFWLLADDHEYFVPFADYPAFREATVGQIVHVEQPDSDQLYWPDLDVDIELAALEEPERFPLEFRG